MNIKEISAIAISAVSVTVSVLGWMEVRFASKSDLEFMYIEQQMGINDIRLRSFERRGLETLNETDKRIYEALKQGQQELMNRRQR